MSTSSIDRQQLLEQKRQRLQEIKQKRLLQQQLLQESRLPTPEFRPSISEQPVRKGVNVSTQTDLDLATIEDRPKVLVEKEVSTYDKAVQTILPVESEEINEKELESDVKLVDKHEIFETELNEALTSSIKLVNKLHVTNTIYLSNGKVGYVDGNATSGIEKWSTFETDKQQAIVSVDVRFNSLAVGFNQAYSNNAIIYNIKTPTIFPEYYLNSLSQIEVLRFDKYNENRIIGGLKNGGICIWDLIDTKVSLMPVLSTPLYSSIINSNKSGIVLHLNKIVFLTQLLLDGNVCIVSISQDGILNIWSSNLLAEPKMSFRIFDKENKIDDLQITSAVYLGLDEVVGTNFIQDIIINANDGKLYKANGDLIHEDTESSMIHSLNKLGNYVITSDSGWNIKLWINEKIELFKVIPVPYIVHGIIVRPVKSLLQFATIGYSNLTNGKFVVDIWDLKKKLYSPVAIVMETEEEITSVSFNDSGDKLVIVSKSNIIIYKIDESLKTNKNTDFDKGL